MAVFCTSCVAVKPMSPSKNTFLALSKAPQKTSCTNPRLSESDRRGFPLSIGRAVHVKNVKGLGHCDDIVLAVRLPKRCAIRVSHRCQCVFQGMKKSVNACSRAWKKRFERWDPGWDPGGIQGQKVGSGVKTCTIFLGKRWDPIVPTYVFIILKAY